MCTTEVIKDTMLPVVLKLAEDPVANVRFNVARTLTKLGVSVEQRYIYTYMHLLILMHRHGNTIIPLYIVGIAVLCFSNVSVIHN